MVRADAGEGGAATGRVGLLWARVVSWAMGLFAFAAAFAALYVLGRMPEYASGPGVLRVVGCILVAMTVFGIVLGLLLQVMRSEASSTSGARSPQPSTATSIDRRRLITQLAIGFGTAGGVIVLARKLPGSRTGRSSGAGKG